MLFFCSTSYSQSHQIAEEYWGKALEYDRQKDFYKAAEMYEKSSEAEKISPHPRIEKLRRGLLSAAISYLKFSQYNKVLHHLQQVLSIDRKLGENEETAFVLTVIGKIYRTLGQYDNALQYYKQSLGIERELGKQAEIAVTLNNIGEIYHSLGQYNKAIQHFQQALKLNLDFGKEEEISTNLNNISELYHSRRQFDKALRYYQLLLQIHRKARETVNIATVLFKIGSVYKSLGRYDNAVNLYQKAMEIFRMVGKEEDSTACLVALGFTYHEMAQHNKAIAHFNQVLKIYNKQGKEEVSGVLRITGENYRSLGQYDKAAQHFEQALEIHRKLGNEGGIATVLNDIGLVYHFRGQYDKAAQHFVQALEIFKKLRNEEGIATVLNNMGEVYTPLGQYDKAAQHFEQALEIHRKLGNEGGIATVLNNTGSLYQFRGQYDKAIIHYQQALEIVRKLGNEGEIAATLNNIGLLRSFWGHYDKAILYYQQALEIHRKLGNEGGIATVLNNMGEVYKAWGQHDKSFQHFVQALEIHRKLGEEASIATDLTNIGLVYSSWGKYSKAIQYHQQALEINKKLGKEGSTASVLDNIGAVYIYSGQYDKAIQYLLQALEINKKLGKEGSVVSVLNNISAVFSVLERHDEAILFLKQALAISRKHRTEGENASVLSNIGVNYHDKKEYLHAIEYFSESIKLKEKLRKTATGNARRDYLASQIGTYQYLISTYIRNQNIVESFEAIEMSRAKLLSERMSENEKTIHTSKVDEIRNKIPNNVVILAYSNSDFDDLVEISLSKISILGKEVSNEEFVTNVLKKYKEPIDKNIEHQQQIRLEQNKTKPPQIIGKKSDSDFENIINYYRSLLTDSSKNKDRGIFISKKENESSKQHIYDISRMLYDLLIKPMESQLKGKTELIIMPDGILSFIPFETLIDEKGRYLVEKFDIKYIQSMGIASIIEKRQFSENRKKMLAFGGAIYNEVDYNEVKVKNTIQLASLSKNTYYAIEQSRSIRNAYASLGVAQWENLPGTVSEVQSISDLIPEAELFLGQDVTENKVKIMSQNGRLSDYKVVHFATHGLVMPSFPELSAIVLSQFKKEIDGEDGYLRMGEISKLNLKADFVNLSACETGLGKIYGGEGVVGLTQSFLIAGANSLSVSLWSVADESTSKFMLEMYRLVEKGGKTYNQAMMEVKRRFIEGGFGEQYKAPFYWAPFVYYGM